MEILVFDDASEPAINPDEVTAWAGHINAACLRSDTQIGLITARNKLISAAAGDVFFIIDDDAYFENEDALELIADSFEATPNVGIVAAKILDYRGGNFRPLTPHTQRQIRQDASIIDQKHLISYFLGGAHAIHKNVIAQCGNFDEVLMFGHEEIDFAYRVIQHKFAIQYLPEVVVYHKPPQSGKSNKQETAKRIYYLTRNRILFAYKHLPLKYAMSYVPAWMGWYGYRALTEGHLPHFFRAIGDGVKTVKQLDRQPIKRTTINYLKQNYGRLWR